HRFDLTASRAAFVAASRSRTVLLRIRTCSFGGTVGCWSSTTDRCACSTSGASSRALSGGACAWTVASNSTVCSTDFAAATKSQPSYQNAEGGLGSLRPPFSADQMISLAVASTPHAGEVQG